MPSEFFDPLYSSDTVYIGTDDSVCLTDELAAMEADITALEIGKANVNHIHTGYAIADHVHANYAASTHTYGDSNVGFCIHVYAIGR